MTRAKAVDAEWPHYMLRQVEHRGSSTKLVQVARCTTPGCEKVGSFSRTMIYPVDVFQQRMSQRGWHFRRHEAHCPTCVAAKRSQRRTADIVSLRPVAAHVECVAQPEMAEPASPVAAPEPTVPMATHRFPCEKDIRLSLLSEGSATVLRMLLRDEHREYLGTDTVQIAVSDGLVEIYPATHTHAPNYQLYAQRAGDEEVWRLEGEIDTDVLIPSSTSMVDAYETADGLPYLMLLPMNTARETVRIEDCCEPGKTGPVRTRSMREPEAHQPRVPVAQLVAAADRMLRTQRLDSTVLKMIQPGQPLSDDLLKDKSKEERNHLKRARWVYGVLKPAYELLLGWMKSPMPWLAAVASGYDPDFRRYSGLTLGRVAVDLQPGMFSEDARVRARATNFGQILNYAYEQRMTLEQFETWAFKQPNLLMNGGLARSNAANAAEPVTPPAPETAPVSTPADVMEQPMQPTALRAVGTPAQPKQMTHEERLSEIKAAFALVNELIAGSNGRIVPRIEDGVLRASVTTVVEL